MSKSLLMSADDYAKHRGCSKIRILQYVKAQQLTPTRTDVKGKISRHWFDPLLADAELMTKMGRKPQVEPKNKPTLRPGRPTKAQKAALEVLAVGEPEKTVQRPRVGKNAGKDSKTPNPWLEIQERKTMAQLKKAEADAEVANIEMLKAAGKLIDADQAEDIYTAMVSDARDAMENVAPFIRSKFPAIDEEIIKEIAEQHRQILSMLSRGKVATT